MDNTPETNSHGVILRAWLEEEGLLALNGRDEASRGYTFYSRINKDTKTVLDFITTSCPHKLNSMTVRNEVDLTGGDHVLITADIGCKKPRRKKKRACSKKIKIETLSRKDGIIRHKWRDGIAKWNKEKWEKAVEDLGKKYSPSKRINLLNKIFMKFIHKHTAKECGWRKCTKGRCKDYWDDECDKLIRLRNAATKKARNSQKLEDEEEAERAQKVWRDYQKKRIYEEKVKEADEIIEAFSNDNANFWKLAKRFFNKYETNKGISSLFVNGTDGECTSEDTGIVQVLKNHACKLATPQHMDHFNEKHYDEIIKELGTLPHIGVGEQDGPITLAEVTEQRAKLRCGKAAGLDGILPEMLKYGKEQIDKVLLPLFQECWCNTAVPDDEWSTAKITWLYKADDARKPGNYRGISLHSVLGKLYVSILNARLTKFLETPVNGEKKISTHQNGFRTGEGRSCQEHILSLTQVLRQRKSEKKDSFVFFQDFSKAFDLVDHRLLHYKLYKMGVTGKLLQNIMRRYKKLKACCIANGKTSEEFQVKVGTAQGCPLSPALFNVFIQDLIDDLNESKKAVITLAYADDIVVVAESAELLQQVINICAIWTGENKMKANVIKSAVMEIPADKKKPIKDTAYTYNGAPLPKVDTYKYLGVLFDDEVSFKKQVAKRKTASRRKMGFFKKFMSLPGMPIQIKRKMVEASILAADRYGVECWGWNHDNDLDIITNHCCRKILQLPDNSSGAGARAIVGIPSLRVTRDIAASKLVVKCQDLDPERLPFQHSTPASFIGKKTRNSGYYRVTQAAGQKAWKSKDYLDSLGMLMKVDQENALSRSKNDLLLLEIRDAGSAKQNESCRSRNTIRLGCSSIHIYNKKLEKELEEKRKTKKNKCKKKKGKKKRRKKHEPALPPDNNPLQRCTLCNGQTLSAAHILTQCECKPQTPGINDIINEATSTTNNGFTVTNWNMNAVTARVLAPEFWTKEQNDTINSHCKRTLAQFHLSTQTKSRDNKLSEKLLELLEEWKPGEELLNENIIGEIFQLTVDEGANKGTWRMRVTDYDPFANEFMLGSQGLDFCPINQNYFTLTNVNLNDDLRKGYLKFIDKNTALTFDKNIIRAIRQMFDHNIVGKNLEIKLEGNIHFTNAKVRSYDHDTRTHVVAVEGSATRDGASSTFDLNKLALNGRIRLEPPTLPWIVASRWLAIKKGLRENSSGAQAAWPMPKGGKHEIT
jgi:hypothetical protein